MSTDLTIDGAVPLAHWGAIRARGADAARFLHSQLTSDIENLPPGRARWSGFCSAKGRLQATFLVWRESDGSLVLACAADLLAPTLKRLSMFVLRAKCQLSDAGAEITLVGLAGKAARRHADGLEVLEQRDGVIRLPDAAGVPRAISATPIDPAATLPLASWRWLEVMSGVPQVVAATVDHFVPQMLNFELVGGVDFSKGCYPGQEIVARSQYRGTIKRRMLRFAADVTLAPGDEIVHSADPGQPAGMVVNAAAAPHGGFSALVEVKLGALGSGSLHLRAADGPLLRLAELPYPLPVVEDITA